MSGREIISVQQADQFLPGKTAYACGFFSVAELTSMAPPGQAPTRSAAEITADAEQWYADYNGENTAANEMGMATDQLYRLLAQVGFRYEILKTGEDIRSALGQGFPVVVAATEDSVWDVGLGRNPYPWTPEGSHIFLITGMEGNNYLVRDSANIEAPNTLRPGPRVYSPSLILLSATSVTPPWRITMIPAGWKDDGKALTAPNGIPVVRGFREYVLAHRWNPDDYPLEPEHGQNPLEISNPSLGGGTQQIFRMTVLEWTPARGVFQAWTGQEIIALRKAPGASSISNLTAALEALVQQYGGKPAS